jgi:hypothetical protein
MVVVGWITPGALAEEALDSLTVELQIMCIGVILMRL